MTTSKVKNLTSWVLVLLLAVGFLMAALGKLTGAAAPMFEGWGYAPWFATLIGIFLVLLWTVWWLRGESAAPSGDVQA